MDLIMPQLAIKGGEFLEVQIEYRAGIPCVWNLIFVMAAGEMLVREWILIQGSVFKETQGSFGLLRAIQSSEMAGMSRVSLRTHPNNPRKSLQAPNCSRNLPEVHYRHISTSHLIPAMCRAQLSSLSPRLLPRLMTPARSQDTALFASGSCTQGKMSFSLLGLLLVSPEGKAATQSLDFQLLQVRAVMGLHLCVRHPARISMSFQKLSVLNTAIHLQEQEQQEIKVEHTLLKAKKKKKNLQR